MRAWHESTPEENHDHSSPEITGVRTMIKKNIEQALNDQINKEMYSSYIYLSMSAHFESIDLSGFAHWMKVQALEELVHAMKIFNYVNERGGRVVLETIDKPQHSWDSPLAVFQHVYEHEQFVTSLINKLVDLAIKERDHATNQFLQWFVEEQVEEEDTANGVVQKLKLVQDGGGLFMLDKELGVRLFTPPTGFSL